MRVLADFPWPIPPGEERAPHWTGQAFAVGDREERVLAYEEQTSHWTDELTTMHEAEAGRDHPIDRASRRLAVTSMRRVASGTHGPVLLDVGCSSGFIIEDLRLAVPSAAVVGADYIRGPLDRLAERVSEVPILQFDLRRCPLPDNCIDGITCLNVLEHIDDHESALRHLYRILKPGGIAHVEVPAGPGLFDIYDEHLMHHRRYRLKDLAMLARAAGFRVDRATHLGFFVFPAFWWVKKRNRRHLGTSAEGKAHFVANQIRATKSNPVFAALIHLETSVGRLVRYPCGIRCVAVLRKC